MRTAVWQRQGQQYVRFDADRTGTKDALAGAALTQDLAEPPDKAHHPAGGLGASGMRSTAQRARRVTLLAAIYLGAVFSSVQFAPNAFAGCVCRCVNGSVQAICSSTLDIQPICATQICPIVPPSIAPIQTPAIPPIGTSSCAPVQVLNPRTNQYEWQRVCQ